MTAAKPSPFIIAAMPAYNEEKYVGTMVLKTRQYVNEVIVIDDGSTDDTAKVARLAGATVVLHDKNKGYGATIQSILAEARKRQPDALVLIDADAQHDPAEIPAMVNALSDGVDLVIGSRELSKNNIPLYRRVGQRILLRSTRMLSNENLTDSESGFRVFSKKAFNTLDIRENGMAASAETISSASEKGLRIVQVPIHVTYSKDSSTLNPIAHGFQVLASILTMISERRPLFLFGIAGTVLAVAGMLIAASAWWAYFMDGSMPVLRSVASVFLLMSALFCYATGVVIYVLGGRRQMVPPEPKTTPASVETAGQQARQRERLKSNK